MVSRPRLLIADWPRILVLQGGAQEEARSVLVMYSSCCSVSVFFCVRLPVRFAKVAWGWVGFDWVLIFSARRVRQSHRVGLVWSGLVWSVDWAAPPSAWCLTAVYRVGRLIDGTDRWVHRVQCLFGLGSILVLILVLVLFVVAVGFLRSPRSACRGMTMDLKHLNGLGLGCSWALHNVLLLQYLIRDIEIAVTVICLFFFFHCALFDWRLVLFLCAAERGCCVRLLHTFCC